MLIILMICLNMFFNVFHLEQIYFRKKYEYFNKKYNIIFNIIDNKISFNERFKYAFNNTITSGIISCFICLILQLILDYFCFNIDRKISIIVSQEIDNKTINKKKSISNKKIKENKDDKDIKNDIFINNLIEKENKKYCIYFSFSFILLIFIFYSIIVFNEVYRGGISDLIAGTFWSFIFLQIFMFIYCLIITLILKYKSN